MNILDKLQHDKLLDEHVDTLRARYENEGLSILELRERFKSLAADSADSEIEPSMRELYAVERKLVHSLIEAATPPIPSPAELLATLKHTNPAAAEALQHQLAIESKEEAVVSAQAALEYAIERKFSPDSEGYKTAISGLESARDALDEALATSPPYIQRMNDAKIAIEKAEQCRIAADAMQNLPLDGAKAAQDKFLEEAVTFEAKANSLRNFNHSASFANEEIA